MQKSIGIDVSKNSLDVAVFGIEEKESVHYNSNNAKTVDAIVSDFSMTPDNCIVVMEVTGIYHLRVFYRLHELGYKVSTVNPLKIKRFAQMKLLKVKTDKADAHLIAEYGYLMKPESNVPPSEVQCHIMQLLKCIEDQLDICTGIVRRLEALRCRPDALESVISSLEKIKNTCESEIKHLEKMIEELVKSYAPDVDDDLRSITGVGQRISSAIIGMFGRMESFSSAKQLCSFVGICPSPRQSGSSVKYGGSISKQGSPYLRKLLYMASLTASRHNNQCSELYQRLLARGKAKKSALIAVANKLLRQIFAVVKHKVKFDPMFGMPTLNT